MKKRIKKKIETGKPNARLNCDAIKPMEKRHVGTLGKM